MPGSFQEWFESQGADPFNNGGFSGEAQQHGIASARDIKDDDGSFSDLLSSGADPLEILRTLASQDEAYLGQYLETLISRQDTASARSFSEWMDSTKYSRAFEDIKKAGYNPWLALQGGLGVSGSQEYSAARTSSSNAYSLKNSRMSAEASERNSKRQIVTSIISAVSTAVMFAMLML